MVNVLDLNLIKQEIKEEVQEVLEVLNLKLIQIFVVDADTINSEEQEILTVSEKGIGKRTTVEEYRLTNRAGSGVNC